MLGLLFAFIYALGCVISMNLQQKINNDKKDSLESALEDLLKEEILLEKTNSVFFKTYLWPFYVPYFVYKFLVSTGKK